MADEAPKKNGKRQSLIVWGGSIAAVAGLVTALNTFTGLSFRPAWGYETERLAAADVDIKQRLDRVLEIQGSTAKAVEQLQRGQFDVKLQQIDRQQREARRALAEHETRAEDQYRSQGKAVPRWLRDAIADTESDLEALRTEKMAVEAQQLELER